MSDLLNVGVSEIKVSSNGDTLASFGLGSCVAVAMHDPIRKIGGLAHVMLPSSRGRDVSLTPGKFADTAVPALLAEMEKLGSRARSIQCKIVGGAHMFESPGYSSESSGQISVRSARIGQSNVEAVRNALKEAGVPLVGEEVGGNHGRTVRFSTETGLLDITSIRFGNCTL